MELDFKRSKNKTIVDYRDKSNKISKEFDILNEDHDGPKKSKLPEGFKISVDVEIIDKGPKDSNLDQDQSPEPKTNSFFGSIRVIRNLF